MEQIKELFKQKPILASLLLFTAMAYTIALVVGIIELILYFVK